MEEDKTLQPPTKMRKTDSDETVPRLIPFEWDKDRIKNWLENAKSNKQFGSGSFSSSAPPTVATTVINALQKTIEKFDSTTKQTEADIREWFRCDFIEEYESIRKRFVDKNYSLNYSHFIIPESGWTMVRPHEYERKFDQNWQQKYKLRLPAVPSETVFYIKNIDNAVCLWEMPPDLINDNGVKVLAEDQRLLAHQKELIGLIYIVAKNFHPLDLNVQTILRDQSFYGFKEEKKMLEIFNARKMAEKIEKTEDKKYSSNYFLLDPREFKSTKVHEDVPFHEFIQSIFYIGTGSVEYERPFNHLKRTFERKESDIQGKYGASFKRYRIRQIWEAGHGVIILTFCDHIDRQQALFQEACLIHARMGKNKFLREYIQHENKTTEKQLNKELNSGLPEYWRNTILGPIDLTNKKDELDQKKQAMFLDGGDSDPTDLTNEQDELGKKKAKFLDGNNSVFAIIGSRLLFRAFGIFRLKHNEEMFEDDFDFKKPTATADSSKRRNSSSSSGSGSNHSSSRSKLSAQSSIHSPSQRSNPQLSPRSTTSSLPLGQGKLDGYFTQK